MAERYSKYYKFNFCIKIIANIYVKPENYATNIDRNLKKQTMGS